MTTTATTTARGPFDVKVIPQTTDEQPGAATMARHALDKRYHGDLDATSKGEMLSAGGPTVGAGAYVAVERVSGTLHGRAGTFALYHHGTMSGGNAQLFVNVVPGTGTGELVGLTGTLKILIGPDGAHAYEFDYSLEG